ncbi:MAG: 5-oxoprolinase subunit PxpB [Abyssibacter sp.]|uniref:5-oxoprolinase subunit PxpB n=1 Tax=Abyssibacter sp. TaxID=2320200 RepID=UPI00321A82A4
MTAALQLIGPIRAAGDGGLIAELAAAPGPGAAQPATHRDPAPAAVRAATHAVADALTAALGRGLIDLVPSSNRLLVLFDPSSATPSTVRRLLRKALAQPLASVDDTAQTVTLPVYYGPEVAWDLSAVAAAAGVTPETVIDWHCQAEYTVRAIGFAPGFAYLGGLDSRLAQPRRATPRVRVPAGAVAIAEHQTAIYPAESPGGWHVLGRCPVVLFDPERKPPLPYAMGDNVRFEPIDRERFLALGGQIDAGA